MFAKSTDDFCRDENKTSKFYYIQADWVYTPEKAPVSRGVVIVDECGFIHSVETEECFKRNYQNVVPENHKGALVPGFVNAHVHLELSHLKAKSQPKQGLPIFLQDMMRFRGEFTDDEMLQAMQEADKEMFVNGIVAVGDISNHALSVAIKKKSTIHYHTFIETMGILPQLANQRYDFACKVAQDFCGLPHDIVPHAPFSVSEVLFELIASKDAALCSIHNQECEAENEFFKNKKGDFLDFYRNLGVDISNFQAKGIRSLPYYLPFINKKSKTLLVHNTFSNEEDIDFALQTHPNLYWCLCPKANRYIEDQLPSFDLFARKHLKMVLGTDSLASNNQLSIADEMFVLQQAFDISFFDLLQMATRNGAEFLGLEHILGTIEIGKKPGLVLMDVQDGKMQSSNVRRLI